MFNDTIKINQFKCRLQTVFLEQDCFKYFIRQYTYCVNYMYQLRIFREKLLDPYNKRKYSKFKAGF